jgi:hypothetical protein
MESIQKIIQFQLQELLQVDTTVREFSEAPLLGLAAVVRLQH